MLTTLSYAAHSSQYDFSDASSWAVFSGADLCHDLVGLVFYPISRLHWSAPGLRVMSAGSTGLRVMSGDPELLHINLASNQ